MSHYLTTYLGETGWDLASSGLKSRQSLAKDCELLSRVKKRCCFVAKTIFKFCIESVACISILAHKMLPITLNLGNLQELINIVSIFSCGRTKAKVNKSVHSQIY